MKRAYSLSFENGRVFAEKVMEEDTLMSLGAKEVDDYLDLGEKKVGLFVLIHDDITTLLDSGTFFEYDGRILTLEYPEYMESGKMYVLWEEDLEMALELEEVRERAVKVLLV